MSRIVLKSDFDGVVSAMLLKSVVETDEIVFAHPEDVLSGDFKIVETDYVINLPFVQQVAGYFSGHSYPEGDTPLSGSEINCCAQKIIEAYPGLSLNAEAVAWAQAAADFIACQVDVLQVTEPSDRFMLGILMDPLTGMGKRKDFLKSNYFFLLEFIEFGLKRSLEQWFDELDLQDRIASYQQDQQPYLAFLEQNAEMQGPVIIVNRHTDDYVPLGNRFVVFSVYDAPYALYLYRGKAEDVVVVAGVVSPFGPAAHHMGAVFNAIGGYGDRGYGTIQIQRDAVDQTIEKLIHLLQ